MDQEGTHLLGTHEGARGVDLSSADAWRDPHGREAVKNMWTTFPMKDHTLGPFVESPCWGPRGDQLLGTPVAETLGKDL